MESNGKSLELPITTEQVLPALPSMIELSLLQDRTAQLLRNDSLQDVNKRADLYFATFAFVDRLYHHDALEHLVKDDRFMKKQSGGLHAIATDWKGKGKVKAAASLAVAHRSEGMGSSLIACLTNLATQSKVLLGGSHRDAAGEDILEIAKRIQKLHTRLAPNTAKLATVTTWKEYLQAYAVTRKADVARHLCSLAMAEAQTIRTSPKNRMKRLVTETSEMTTSLPANVFVMIDEVRPDIMKVGFHLCINLATANSSWFLGFNHWTERHALRGRTLRVRHRLRPGLSLQAPDFPTRHHRSGQDRLQPESLRRWQSLPLAPRHLARCPGNKMAAA